MIGGDEKVFERVRPLLEAMGKGKHVVTANKALLAVHGEELYQAASRAGVDIGFEGSVCGGVPILRALTEGLAANRLLSLYGIVNGTSNYILTRMTEAGQPFDVVLAEAQKAGYAEADPTFDVAGIDAGCEEPDSDFAIARHQVREFRDLQHFPGRALPLIPSCSHRKPPSR